MATRWQSRAPRNVRSLWRTLHIFGHIFVMAMAVDTSRKKNKQKHDPLSSGLSLGQRLILILEKKHGTLPSELSSGPSPCPVHSASAGHEQSQASPGSASQFSSTTQPPSPSPRHHGCPSSLERTVSTSSSTSNCSCLSQPRRVLMPHCL